MRSALSHARRLMLAAPMPARNFAGLHFSTHNRGATATRSFVNIAQFDKVEVPTGSQRESKPTTGPFSTYQLTPLSQSDQATMHKAIMAIDREALEHLSAHDMVAGMLEEDRIQFIPLSFVQQILTALDLKHLLTLTPEDPDYPELENELLARRQQHVNDHLSKDLYLQLGIQKKAHGNNLRIALSHSTDRILFSLDSCQYTTCVKISHPLAVALTGLLGATQVGELNTRLVTSLPSPTTKNRVLVAQRHLLENKPIPQMYLRHVYAIALSLQGYNPEDPGLDPKHLEQDFQFFRVLTDYASEFEVTYQDDQQLTNLLVNILNLFPEAQQIAQDYLDMRHDFVKSRAHASAACKPGQG